MYENYIKEHKHKEGSFVLGKVGDEWQMFKKGKYFSAYPSEEKFTRLMVTAGRDKTENNEMLKKRVVAVIRGSIHDSVVSMNKLAEKAGCEDFNIDYDYIIEKLKLKSYELFGE